MRILRWNLSHQKILIRYLYFSRELSSTFARLCNYVDLSKDGLKGDLLNLDKEIRRLEDTSKQSKSLRYLYIVELGVEIRKNQ